jgi:ABC-type amino acid transport substrate-binding protein
VSCRGPRSEASSMIRMSALLWAGMILVAPFRASVAEAPCTLRVGWEPYAPYTYPDSAGEVTGADIDLVRAVAAEIGCTVEFAEPAGSARTCWRVVTP